MLVMTTVEEPTPADTAAFQLSVVGVVVAQRYADRIASLALKPKHVALLSHLASNQAASQLDVARAMGVAPSLVVRLTDHLQQLGAIGRRRDPADRRRQTLQLTDRGRALLVECTTAATSLDADILNGLSAAERKALHSALQTVLDNLRR
jgi:DNA-binding MarR family transcriptional regulator